MTARQNAHAPHKLAAASSERQEDSIAAKWSRNVAIAFFVSALCVVYLSHGAVYPEAISISTLLMSVSLMLGYLTLGVPPATRNVFLGILCIWLFVAAWTIMQAMPLPAGMTGNAAWRVLQDIGIASPEFISPAPADTLAALGPISLPAITLLSVLILFRRDTEIERALRVFCVAGGLMAAFAILQFIAFPRALMLTDKQYYLGSLTAPFVNRNTAATFYGVTLVAMICQLKGLRVRLIPGSDLFYRRDGWTPLEAAGWLLLCLVTLTAVVLTQSRGGVLATTVALMGQIAFSVFFRTDGNQSTGISQAWTGLSVQQLLKAAAFAVVAIVVVGFFAGRVMLRAQVQGLDDGRVCVIPGILAATRDHLLVGAGAGAFPVLFPAYRDAACGLNGYWPMAHNFYLDGLLALGLPFVVITGFFIAMLARAVGVGLRRRRKKRSIVAAAACATVLVLIHSATDFSVQIPGFSTWWVLFLGLCLTVAYGRRTMVRIKN
ncbi:O-antigen ligase family protein [Rhizobium sp. SGZ-381]|uniref:O-antigen ligase family protein n=1 Tax=Rhizobium sp. SGZ-381 TaxID=3342800 RepID=UPI003671128E